MKLKNIFTLFFLLQSLWAVAQNDTTEVPVIDTVLYGQISVVQDPRIEVLGKKLAEYNEALNLKKTRTGKGYRLMVLSTNDRQQVLSVRSNLIRLYPEHKVYMIFQSPFIKLKLGNFLEKKDAEDLRKQLVRDKVVTGNIYLLPETIEIKPEVRTGDEE